MIAARRAAPQADLLSELVHLEDAGERLSDDELVATCILLLFAGHETTTNHIANGLLGLLRFPQEMAKLREDPTLAAAAVEELLRYDGPNGAQVLIVQQDHHLHGKRLQRASASSYRLRHRDPRSSSPTGGYRAQRPPPGVRFAAYSAWAFARALEVQSRAAVWAWRIDGGRAT